MQGSYEIVGASPVVTQPRLQIGQQYHAWTPLTYAAVGTASFHLGSSQMLSLQGDAYFDRNGSEHPLHELGFSSWIWGHSRVGEVERVFFTLRLRDCGSYLPIGFEIDADGTMHQYTDLKVDLIGRRHTLYGMPSWQTIALSRGDQSWLELSLNENVELGPFYLRYLVSTPLGSHGSAEIISPDRVDLARHRFAVQMPISHGSGDNSVWLPLFQGPKRGRVGRLFQQLKRPNLSLAEARSAQ